MGGFVALKTTLAPIKPKTAPASAPKTRLLLTSAPTIVPPPRPINIPLIPRCIDTLPMPLKYKAFFARFQESNHHNRNHIPLNHSFTLHVQGVFSLVLIGLFGPLPPAFPFTDLPDIENLPCLIALTASVVLGYFALTSRYTSQNSFLLSLLPFPRFLFQRPIALTILPRLF